MNRKLLMVLVSTVVLMAGCASKKPKADAPTSAGPTTSVGASTAPVAGNTGSQTAGVATVNLDRGNTTGGALGPVGALGAQRVIYFDYDSSDIRNEFVDVIAAHGRFLAGNATVRVRLEGHSDERGSREYNIGLAERRAQTVKRALSLQGVQESQVAIVSYGEERPAAVGSDENAYSKNRRVEIVYIN
ncbi:MAG: peptidoglycan-associated lipoprotein Pal [Steroidobacteraceae bacterium]